MDLSTPGSSVHGIILARILESVGCHFLLQGIFLAQGLNPSLLHLLRWHVGSLPLSHLGSPLYYVKTQQKDSHLWGSGHLPDTKSVSALILDLLVSKTVRNMRNTFLINRVDPCPGILCGDNLRAAVHRLAKSWTRVNYWATTILLECHRAQLKKKNLLSTIFIGCRHHPSSITLPMGMAGSRGDWWHYRNGGRFP